MLRGCSRTSARSKRVSVTLLSGDDLCPALTFALVIVPVSLMNFSAGRIVVTNAERMQSQHGARVTCVAGQVVPRAKDGRGGPKYRYWMLWLHLDQATRWSLKHKSTRNKFDHRNIHIQTDTRLTEHDTQTRLILWHLR